MAVTNPHSREALEAWEAEDARRRAAGLNTFIVRDQGYAQRFSDLWFEQNKIATREQKEYLALVFLEKALGLSWLQVQRYVEGDPRTHEMIRLRFRLMGLIDRPIDVLARPEFTNILSDHFSSTEIAFIIKGEPSQEELTQFWAAMAAVSPEIDSSQSVSFLSSQGLSGPRLLFAQYSGLNGYSPGVQSCLLNGIQRLFSVYFSRDVSLFEAPLMKTPMVWAYWNDKEHARAIRLLDLMGVWYGVINEPDYGSSELTIHTRHSCWTGTYHISRIVHELLRCRIHGDYYRC